MRPSAPLFVMLLLPLAGAGCMTTSADDSVPRGSLPICNGTRTLGRIAVIPSVSWRADQKEPELREAMIARGLRRAFARLPCGVTTKSDIAFTLTAYDVARDEVILGVRRHWQRGGPFVLRGASVLADDLEGVHADLIGTPE